MIRGPGAVIVKVAAVVLASGILACGSGGTGASDGGDGGGSGGNSGAGGGSGAADGGSSTTVSCTITQTTTTNPPLMLKSCIETSGLSTQAEVEYLRTGCMTPASDAGPTPPQQQFAIGPCSRDRALGACSTPPSGTYPVTTRWWYDDGLQTANDVRAICQALGDTFVAP